MPNVLTAVADSTMLVSAFVRPEGLSALLLRHAAGGDFELHLSHEIIAETQTTLLEREPIRRRYRYTNDEVAAFCQLSELHFLWSPIFPPSPVLSVIRMTIWSLPQPYAPRLGTS
jgi:hypothetical protein